MGLVDGRIRVRYQTCLSSDLGYCTGDADHVCEVVTSGLSPLDCVDNHKLRRPRWLPESVLHYGRPDWTEGTPWDAGSQRITFDSKAGIHEVAIEVAPLRIADGDVASYSLAGPTWYGRIDPNGEVGFDGPEEVSRTREECKTLPPPSKAPAKDLWRSAVCWRLLGKTVPWIAEQWRQRCAGPKPAADNAGPDTHALERACHVDVDYGSSRERGFPKVAVHYLEQVVPFSR